MVKAQSTMSSLHILHVSFDAFSDGNQVIIIYIYQLATGGCIAVISCSVANCTIHTCGQSQLVN